MAEEKRVNCIVLDAGPLILNDPSISSLLAESHELFTTSAVIAEIRDPAARARLETTVQPFLKIRNPSPASIKVVSDFARRTGDLAVLSGPDLQILALAYELEVERNHGDWRLRRAPGQKALNGPQPASQHSTTASETNPDSQNRDTQDTEATTDSQSGPAEGVTLPSPADTHKADDVSVEDISQSTKVLSVQDTADTSTNAEPKAESSDDSEGGWITPSNLAARKARDEAGPGSEDTASDQAVMEVATITTDYAMQNVLLQMNLNLLSTALRRVKNIKSHIMRCHACFTTTKDMTKQFCPRCGNPALTRVACSTKSNGTFVLHLKKNFQYNKRGDRFSIPKPVAGSANGRVQGGGKGGWGNELILTEDQKEYTRALQGHKKSKQRNPMDENYLPGILSGDRNASSGGSRPKVGAGRNVNSKKR